jgi:hypothetical protein
MSVNTLATERRQWDRFLNDVVHVHVSPAPGVTFAAEVLDESFGGIGLLVDDAQHLAVGRVVELEYNDTPLEAIVRHISPKQLGRHRVGLEWQACAEFETSRGRAAHSRPVRSNLEEQDACRDALVRFVADLPRGVYRIDVFARRGAWRDLSRVVLEFQAEAEALGFAELAAEAEGIVEAAGDDDCRAAVEHFIQSCCRARGPG